MENSYSALGLKCGIEIHQQLEGTKLFCDCPTYINADDDPHHVIYRRLRAVSGETGQTDAAASQEQEKAKQFAYRIYNNSCCLVELDEQPPLPLNDNALYTTLQVCKLLNASIVKEAQIMRKTVIDGSNTTGFQRTLLVGYDGAVQTAQGQVRIANICLEEDSAKIISRTPTCDTYNLSRLGIPLIEIGTHPDITSPQQCQQVASMLGMMLRSTGRVKRGLGTIRQDVNISIEGGNRIEIKGAQDLEMIPTLVSQEVERQLKIIQLNKTFKRSDQRMAGITFADVSDIFTNTNCKLIAKALSNKQHVVAFVLPQLNKVVGTQLQPNYRLGSDFSDYAKARLGVGGLMHSDEDLTKKYQFTTQEIEQIRKRIKPLINDAFVIMVGKLDVISKGVDIIKDRIAQFAKGVPKEVRKAKEDGTTSYLRPMPGSARMYPETDTLPVNTTTKVTLPELLDDKQKRYITTYKMSTDLAHSLVWSASWPLFEQMTDLYPSLKPVTIAEHLIATPTQLRRKLGKECTITDIQWQALFKALATQQITASAISGIIEQLIVSDTPLDDLIQQAGPLDEPTTRTIVNEIRSAYPDGSPGLLMGKIMQRSNNRANPQLVKQLLDS